MSPALLSYGLTLHRWVEAPGRLARVTSSDDRLWLTFGAPEAGRGAGLAEVDLATGQVTSLDAELPTSNVLCAHHDGRTLWLGTDRGVCRYDPGREQFILLDAPEWPVSEIAAAHDGGLWLGGPKTVVRLEPEVGFGRSYDIPLPAVQRIVDRLGAMFCGSDVDEGIVMVDKMRHTVNRLPLPGGVGYVRDLYAAGGKATHVFGIVGNAHFLMDPYSYEAAGLFSQSLCLAATVWGARIVVGGTEGLHVLLPASLEAGPTIDNLGRGGRVHVADVGVVNLCHVTPRGVLVGATSGLYWLSHL